MNINFNRAGKPAPQGPLAKIVALIVGVLTLTAAFMFSLVFVVVLVVGGVILWLYFWWKTRALRAQMREQMQAQREAMNEQPFAERPFEPAAGSEIIEGEAVRVVDEKDRLTR